MRIIAGKYKSRKINSRVDTNDKYLRENHRNLRPTTDRSRESLFNILNNIIDFSETQCLDLFAGTGSVGFELLSRGASFVDFVDSSAKQAMLIEKTAAELDCLHKVKVHRKDSAHFLDEKKGGVYDLIFADPPYGYDDNDSWMKMLDPIEFTVFVLEYSNTSKFSFSPAAYDVLDRKIGITNFRIFVSQK